VSFGKILIAVEGGDVGGHAADVGFELARTLGAEIGLVHATVLRSRFRENRPQP
jgi:hypothetical protein